MGQVATLLAHFWEVFFSILSLLSGLKVFRLSKSVVMPKALRHGCTYFFQNFGRRRKFLGAGIVRRGKSYAEGPQTLGAAVQRLVAWASGGGDLCITGLTRVLVFTASFI
jgi:hypothetical protein